jgi:hypothetical protein
MTKEQETALREYLQEAIVPLIEQVLVKKLGQAMSFAAQEIISPKRKPLTDEEINALDYSGTRIEFVRAIEAAHGIGENK